MATVRTRGEFVAVGTALALNAANLLVTAYHLVENPGKLEAVPLFYTSIGIWTGNLLTTSTAFSPTEAMPMTPRAKSLVMLQSAISLATIAIVAARTINILG